MKIQVGKSYRDKNGTLWTVDVKVTHPIANREYLITRGPVPHDSTNSFEFV